MLIISNNISAPRDCFQDYNIIHLVRDMKSFTNDYSWIDGFGQRIIDVANHFGYSYCNEDDEKMTEYLRKVEDIGSVER